METKWFWMMDWCKSHEYAPANPVFWKWAEQAYESRSE